MDNLSVNSLIEWRDPTQPETTVERVLQINAQLGEVFVIKVAGNKGLPERRKVADIQDALHSGEARILREDPWLSPAPADIHPKHLKKRDWAWEIIRPIVEIPNLFKDIHARAQAIKKAVVQTSEKHVYALLRKYWQGGQTKDALIPRYHHCGSRGTLRAGKTRKTGPKSKSPHARGKRLTEQDLAHIDHGITLFYENQKESSIRGAYRQTIQRFYHEGFTIKDGVTVPLIKPPHELPTAKQFKNRLKTTRNPATLLLKRRGERRFNLEHRPVLGKHRVLGPGSHYAIDFTIADVYLVSSINRDQTIGRPTIYLIVDYFSHLITGINVTMEHGNFVNAGLAIECAATNKVEFCRRYGVEISDEDWPAHHLPTALLADRGELRGPIANTIVETLGVRLDNTPPYRADLKGLVERTFGLLNTELLHLLPGRVKKDQNRGDEKPAEQAALTLQELTKLVIKWALARNQEAINEFRPDEDTVDVTPTPLALWNWGVANRSGSLRTFPDEHIRAALLPLKKAAITRRGIRLSGNYYSCKTAMENHWFVLPGGKQRSITCHYDPRDASFIYLRADSGFEMCHLTNQSDIAKNRSWMELEIFHARQMAKKTEATAQAVQLRASLDAEIAAVTPKKNKKKITKNIRDARAAEILHTRSPVPKQPTNIVPMTGDEDEVEAAQLKLLQKING